MVFYRIICVVGCWSACCIVLVGDNKLGVSSDLVPDISTSFFASVVALDHDQRSTTVLVTLFWFCELVSRIFVEFKKL